MDRVIAIALVAAGLVLAGWVALDPTGDDIGTIGLGEAASPTPSASPAATAVPDDDAALASPSPAPSKPSPSPLPPITTSSGSIDDVDLSRPPAPQRVELPGLGIDAAVVTVGTLPDGEVVVPDDVSTIGWYRGSRTPSEGIGNVIMIGHVDSATQGRGAFFDLRIAELGDTVEVVDDEGALTTWQVTGRRTFEKSAVPMNLINDYYRDPRLVLITCGGEFDPVARSYESIVVVVAEPVP